MDEKDFDLMQWIKEKEESDSLLPYSAIPVAIGAKSGFKPYSNFFNKFSEPLENIEKSREASKKSGFGEFVEAEKNINKAKIPTSNLGSAETLVDELGPLEKEALANAYKEGVPREKLMKMFMDSKVGKMASGATELAGKGLGFAGKVAEPLVAYSSGKEFLEEMQKSPEFLSMSPDEKREFVAKSTGSLGETIGAGVGTAATGAQLLARGIGSNTLIGGALSSAAAPFIVPAAGLTGTAMLSKYMGPHLAKGAEEASAMPGGTMASRLGGDPNAENPEVASGSAPLSALEKQEVEKLFGKNRTDMPFMMASEEERKPTALDLQEMPSSVSSKVSVPSAQKEMQDFVNLEKQQGADYAKRLEEAERQARENEALGLASKAISQIAGGIAQTKARADLGKVDTSIADEFLKKSDKPLEELKRSIEMEKDDPNSAASKSIRAIAQRELKNIGMNIDLGNMSYAQIKNIFPEIERRAERLETAKYRQAALNISKSNVLDEKMAKRASELNKILTEEIASSRSAFGKAANIRRSAEAIEQLVNQIPNPNDLDSRQIKEIARSLDAMLSQGAATVSGTKGLVPKSLSGDVNSIFEYVSNIPRGQKQGEFVKRMIETVKREKELAGEQINRTKEKFLGGYTDVREKAPEIYEEILGRHGIEDTYKEDKEAEKFIKENINSKDPIKRDQAIKILNLRKQKYGI